MLKLRKCFRKDSGFRHEYILPEKQYFREQQCLVRCVLTFNSKLNITDEEKSKYCSKQKIAGSVD